MWVDVRDPNKIQAIKTVNDIKEVVGADAALLLVGERTPAICRLYTTLVQEHERIIKEKFHLIGYYQALDASVTKFFEATQKVLDGVTPAGRLTLQKSRIAYRRTSFSRTNVHLDKRPKNR
ncbi:hypothetical protein CC2G_005915 [Coprinopsis cinerea AmutBmut pab1-1]|nr:hypothetical protein CC2G_005915 [Coprinopsis cinerea AmutBmut pab1-1]